MSGAGAPAEELPLWRRGRLGRVTAPTGGRGVTSAAIVLAAGRYGVAVFGWAGSLVLVRALSPEVWGQYSLIFAIMSLVGSLADLQLGRSVVKDLEADPPGAGRTLGSLIVLRLLVGGVCYVVAVGTVEIAGYPSEVSAAMAVAATLLLFGSASSAYTLYLNSRMCSASVALSAVAAQVVQFVLIGAIALSGYHHLLLFSGAAVLYEVVYLALVRWRAGRGTVVELNFDYSQWGGWLREALLLAVGAMLGYLYLKVDIFLLSKLGSIVAVGIYAVGSKFASLSASIGTAAAAALLAPMTRAWPDRPADLIASFRRGFLLLWAVGVALVVEFMVFATPLIDLLYGRRYSVGADAARGLVLAEVISFFIELCFVTLVAQGRNRVYLLSALGGLIVNVGLNVVLVPGLSYNGSSIATLATAAVVLVPMAAAVGRHRTPGAWIPWRGVRLAAVAGSVQAIVAVTVRLFLPWEAAAALSSAVYLAVLYATRVGTDGG